jgi:hypothetical protein
LAVIREEFASLVKQHGHEAALAALQDARAMSDDVELSLAMSLVT